MAKNYVKTFFRELTKNLGRFIAIIAIVALGVGFLTGLLASTPNMKSSVDDFFDAHNSADIFMKSSRGFEKTDIDKLLDNEMVEKVSAVYQKDVIGKVSGKSPVVRMIGLSDSDFKSSGTVNAPNIIAGRTVEREGECVVESADDNFIEIKLGEKIEADGNEYVVVGICSTPWYFSGEREAANVGGGKVEAVLYCSNFTMPVYTDLFLTVVGAKKMNSFADNYQDKMETTVDEIKALGKTINNEHYDKLIADFPFLAGTITKGEFYVFDRSYNPSFISFKMNVDKVADVATVFPFFFFLVAALVALTTMTRMVEEERTQIGTLKSLGYSNSTIRFKYVAYSLLASGLGSAIGVLMGFWMLPSIIWSAYEFMYALPTLSLAFNYLQAGISCLVATGGVVMAGLFAANKTLKEKPAQLLLPKAPKAGKRILLERLTPIWKRMKFKHKSTFRNIFRYKKHLFMTIIGIAGCTALVLTGFGLSDSINGVSTNQYDKLFRYDYTIGVAADNKVQDYLLGDSVDKYLFAHTGSGIVKGESSKESVTLVVPSDLNEFKSFVSLKNRDDKTEYTNLDENSVVLTESTANKINAKVGDDFKFTEADGKEISLKLTHISENYVGSYMYVGSAVIADTNTNFVYVIAKGDYSESDTLAQLLKTNGVMSVDFLTTSRGSVENLSSSIGFLVLVLILCAGGLAVIVLYNLTNININERKKELATLKVLGYTDTEVAGYIYREIILLTIMGIIVGLVLGFFLHWFVVVQAESAVLMFFRTISPLSYLYSALITLGFSFVVDALMLIKLKQISMVESMKAPE